MQNIAELYEEWLRLTHAEGEAIRLGDWQKTQTIQSVKTGLQPVIQKSLESFASQSSRTNVSPFHLNIGRLISLETRNSELLKTQLSRLEAERLDAEQSKNNLRRIRNSYSLQSQPAGLMMDVGKA